ncbi:MAG: universal stress protein [Actinomycetota bacterium]|jgi:nucleotide-binding universal stress UspA family protein
MGEIIVGVDESEHAVTALRWAAHEGQLRGWTITAVMAWGFLDQHQTIVAERFDPSYGEDDAAAALGGIVTGALGAEAAGAVERRVVCDLPARSLLEASATADLLVVGARGMGGFKGLLLGSVSQQCLHHATTPVAVVRGEPLSGHEARVVAAVDGSATAHRALAWAVDEARLRSARLAAVNAWHPPYVGGYPFTGAMLDPDEFERASRQLLADALQGVDTSGLPAPVEAISAYGAPAAAILEHAPGADLIVMGSRGLGGFKGLLLGSVTVQVIHHAETTVLVIPPSA